MVLYFTINENNNQPREVSYNFSYLEKYNQQEKLSTVSINDDKHYIVYSIWK